MGVRESLLPGDCQGIKMCQKPSQLEIGEKESYEISEKDAGTVTGIARLTHESATNLQTHHGFRSRYGLVDGISH